MRGSRCNPTGCRSTSSPRCTAWCCSASPSVRLPPASASCARRAQRSAPSHERAKRATHRYVSSAAQWCAIPFEISNPTHHDGAPVSSMLTDILETALPASTSVALAASGEMLNERAGTLNLGQEGTLSLGAVAAFIVGTNHDNPFLALAVGVLVGALAGIAFATAAVVIRANQVLAGLALAVGGIGLANQLGNGRQGDLLLSRFEPVEIPVLSDIPLIGEALFNQDPVVYFAFYVLPVVLWFLLFQTRHGMNLRAVGENPAAADAVGVNVTGMRFAYATIGAALSGAGGAHLVLGYTQNWSIGVVSGAGWVSLAVVIFAAWRPFLVVLGSLLFGAMTSLGFVAQARGWDVPSYVLAMLPYIVTLVLILVPAGLAGFSPRLRASAAPASLAVPYFREDR